MLQFAAMPAERRRGAKLVEDFYSADIVARNGWTTEGAPTFADGGTFDGTDDAISNPRVVLGCNGVGFWITLGSTTEQVITLSATHSVTVSAGVVTATGWTAPTIMVNGAATTAITTARSYVTITTATAFTANTIIVGKIGANFGAFKLERLSIWRSATVLSLAEHTAYYNSSMWTWRNRATVDLQFRTADYDIANKRTLDSSGNGNHFTLGDGVTPTTYPTQGAGRMTFDGGDYLAKTSVAQPAGAFSVCWTYSRSLYAGTLVYGRHTDGGLTDLSWQLQQAVAGAFTFIVGDAATYIQSNAHKDSARHTVIGTWDGTTANIYFDGASDKASTTGVPAQPAGAVQTMWVGRAGAGTFAGTMYDWKYFNGLAINATQALDYHESVMRTIGSEV